MGGLCTVHVSKCGRDSHVLRSKQPPRRRSCNRRASERPLGRLQLDESSGAWPGLAHCNTPHTHTPPAAVKGAGSSVVVVQQGVEGGQARGPRQRVAVGRLWQRRLRQRAIQVALDGTPSRIVVLLPGDARSTGGSRAGHESMRAPPAHGVHACAPEQRQQQATLYRPAAAGARQPWPLTWRPAGGA